MSYLGHTWCCENCGSSRWAREAVSRETVELDLDGEVVDVTSSEVIEHGRVVCDSCGTDFSPDFD